jgi:hypothetical protein
MINHTILGMDLLPVEAASCGVPSRDDASRELRHARGLRGFAYGVRVSV